jgi:signal transduction histidine kinase
LFSSKFSGLGSRHRWSQAFYFLCVVLLSLLLLAQRAAQAQSQLQASTELHTQATAGLAPMPLTAELGLYIDSTRLMEIHDVSRQVFAPFKLLLNRSFEPTTQWLKIKVDVPAGQQTPLVLAVSPYFLTELELYYEDSRGWVKQLGGAKHPDLQQQCFIGHHCFALLNSGAHPHVYFLRVNTFNGFYVSTKVFTSDTLAAEAGSNSLLYGVQIGVLLALIGWSAVYLIRFRALVVGWFCLTQISALFLYCFSNGVVLHEFIPVSPDQYARIMTSAICLRLIFASCFCLEISRRWQVRSWFRYYCLFWIAFWFVQISLIFMGQGKQYLLLLNWIFLFTAPFFFSLAIYQSEQFSRQLRMYWIVGALLIGALMCAEAALLLNDGGLSLLISVPGIGASVLAAIVLYLLSLGYSKMQQEQLLLTMFELNSLKAQNDYEQRQLKERSTLIDMLSHELKNPLATIRMALGSLQLIFGKSEQAIEFNERFFSMTQSIDNMTQVLDRVGQVDAIDQKNFVLRYEKLAVLETIESLPSIAARSDRFKLLGLREINTQTDRFLFVTIISNLVDNALKYSSSASTIEISVSVVSVDKLLCIVSNQVEPHHEPDPAALFTRYYRGLYSHDKSGTGLGLVLIKSLCEILKGSVSYRVDDNRVFFSVELPL